MSAEKPLCIGFGKREGRCLNDAGSSHSQLWCQECDNARCKHLDRRFQQIQERLPDTRRNVQAGLA